MRRLGCKACCLHDWHALVVRAGRCTLVALAFFAAFALYVEQARARTTLGAGLSAAEPLPDGLDRGLELDAELGSRFEVPLLAVTGEIGGSYAQLPDLRIYRGLIGARLAVGAIVQPSIFAHIGVGRANFADVLQRDSNTGFTYDVGLALDLTVLPIIDVGVQLAYVALTAPDPTLDWVRLGVHVTLVF